MTTLLPRLAILGAGAMGGAILGGIQQPGLQVEGIRVTTATKAKAQSLASERVNSRSLEEDHDANLWAIEQADIILLGVKPYRILELLQSIREVAPPGAIIVSVAAGITIDAMEAIWPGAVIRSMPNTPAKVGLGVTGVAVGNRVSPEQKYIVVTLFETVGDVVVVDESAVNALSSLSGSGPAYVYFLIERFMEVALRHGFTQEQATTMVQGTFHGALRLLQESGQSPQELREAVTSPGGTTQAALSVFEKADLGAIIHEATDAAIARANELAGE